MIISVFPWDIYNCAENQIGVDKGTILQLFNLYKSTKLLTLICCNSVTMNSLWHFFSRFFLFTICAISGPEFQYDMTAG